MYECMRNLTSLWQAKPCYPGMLSRNVGGQRHKSNAIANG